MRDIFVSSGEKDVWAWQRTATAPEEAQSEETPRCFLCGLKGLSRGELDAKTSQSSWKPKPNRCDAGCKFHMLKNPWSEHVTPSEHYNPVWTGIPNPPPTAKRQVSGDIKAFREKQRRSGAASAPRPSTPQVDVSYEHNEPNNKSTNEEELSHENSKHNEPNKESTNLLNLCAIHQPKTSRPSSTYSQRPLTAESDPGNQGLQMKRMQQYCFGCEKALAYKLFTQTLKVRREVEEARYRSNDKWMKYKVRKGTTPVHAYWPTKTWDADHWPLMSGEEAQKKLEICGRRAEVLHKREKQDKKNMEKHPPKPKAQPGFRTTDITCEEPHHLKNTRHQCPTVTVRVLPLRTIDPISFVTPHWDGAQKRRADLIYAPHPQGVPLYEKKEYSLQHVHAEDDPIPRHFDGGRAFTPVYSCRKPMPLSVQYWQHSKSIK